MKDKILSFDDLDEMMTENDYDEYDDLDEFEGSGEIEEMEYDEEEY